MSWPSRLLVFSAALAAGYAGWRWLRRQAHSEPAPASYDRPLDPPLPPVDPPSGGVRRIPTRIHRGSPPDTNIGLSSAPAVDVSVGDDNALAAAVAASHAQPIEAAAELAIIAPPEAVAAEPTAEVGEVAAEEADTTGAEVPVADEPVEGAIEAERAVGDNGNHDEQHGTMAQGIAPLLTPAVGELININTADLDALISLPGIGPALARRIIAYRKAHGPFASVQALIDIPGIGTRNIEEFAHLVTV
ncbi:helix-hairpin-helix domain-containing protein [Candidatus Gracilibacteria bacterium]|nr:helix-hairpin-helix domain-containing protein [Candidatus Gracilibacteria bacterium]